MSFVRRISDADAERVLGAVEPNENGTLERGELEPLVLAIRASVPAQPSPELEPWLVPRLAEAARASGAAAGAETTTALSPARRARAPWSRRALAAKVAVAAALVPMLAAGLAVAGVTLPGPARSAFERVGIDLPNQSAVDDSSTSAGDEGAGGDEAAASGDHQGSKGGEGEDAGSGKPSKGSGKSHGRGHGHRGGRGASGSSGNSASAPGQQGTAPGLQGTTPGQGATPPGQGGTPPGQTFEPASPEGSGPPSSPPGQSKP